MVTEMNSLKGSIREAEMRGVAVLGTIATWSVPTKCKIGKMNLDMLMDAEGLSSGVVPNEPSWSTALRRAAQMFNAKGKVKLKRIKSNVLEQYAAYELIEDKANVAVVSEDRGHVTLENGGVLVFSDPTAENSWGQRLKKWFTKDLDSSDIRETIKATIVKESAFPLRSSGGVYFIPEEGSGALDAIQKVCSQISGDISFVLLPVLGDDRSKGDLQTAFTDSTVRRIQQTQERLADFFGDGKRKQIGASLSKVKEIDEIRGLIVSYSVLLEDEMESVEERLKQLEDFSKDRLDDVLSGREDSLGQDDREWIEGLGNTDLSAPEEPKKSDVDDFLESI